MADLDEVLKEVREKEEVSTQTSKSCVFCLSDIDKEASVCRYCTRRQDKPLEYNFSISDGLRLCWSFVLFAILLAIVSMFLSLVGLGLF